MLASSCRADLPAWSEEVVVLCGAQGGCPRGSTCDTASARCVLINATLEGEPPPFLAPADQSVADLGDVVVAWRPVPSALGYTLEVSTTDDFATPISGSPFTTERDRTDVSFTATEPVSYYLRLRADITEAGRYTTLTVHALGDAVYVACAPSQQVCTDNAAAVGNRSYPAQTINGGLSRALSLGRSLVKVATRGSEEAYEETVVLPGGVALSGGYSEDFATNDPDAFPTIIRGTAAVTVVANGGLGARAATSMRGFTVRATGTEGSSAFFVLYGDDAIEVTDNVFENFAVELPPEGGSTTAAVRIEARFEVDSPPFVLRGNRIATDRIGIRVRETNVALRDNVVDIYPSSVLGSREGIVVDGGVSTIEGNLVSVDAGGTGIHLLGNLTSLDGSSVSRIVGNTIAMSGGRSMAIRADCCQRPRTISGNVITGIDAPGFRGMVLTGGSGVVSNNSIVSSGLPTAINDIYGLFRNAAAGIVIVNPTTLVGNDSYAVDANTIAISAFSPAEPYTDALEIVGIDVSYGNQIPVAVTNNLIALGGAPSDGAGLEVDLSRGIRVASTLTLDQISQAAVVNNTTVLEATHDGIGVSIAGRLGTIAAVNNLVGFDRLPGVTTTTGIALERWPGANIGAITANAIAGAQNAFGTPSGAVVHAELLSCPAFMNFQPPDEPVAWPLCAGNASGPSSSSLWSFADLALNATHGPSGATPANIRQNGVDTHPRQLGGVVADVRGTARTCDASACYSIGATNP